MVLTTDNFLILSNLKKALSKGLSHLGSNGHDDDSFSPQKGKAAMTNTNQ